MARCQECDGAATAEAKHSCCVFHGSSNGLRVAGQATCDSKLELGRRTFLGV